MLVSLALSGDETPFLLLSSYSLLSHAIFCLLYHFSESHPVSGHGMKTMSIIVVVIIVILALFLIVWKYRHKSMGSLPEDYYNYAPTLNNTPTPSRRQGTAAHNGTSGTLEENEGSALSFSPPAYDEVAGQNRTPGSVGQNVRSESSPCNPPMIVVTGTQDEMSSGPSMGVTQSPGGQTSNPPTYEEAISMTDLRF